MFSLFCALKPAHGRPRAPSKFPDDHHLIAAAHHVSAAHHNQRAMHFRALGADEAARAEALLAFQHSELAHYHTATARELEPIPEVASRPGTPKLRDVDGPIGGARRSPRSR